MVITVTKQDGTKFPLVSAANKSTVTQGEQKTDLLGEDVVTLNVISGTPLPFDIGDTIEVFGYRYTMNALPEMTKRGNRVFAYGLVFEGIQYELTKARYLDLDSQGLAFSGDFSAMLNLRDFCEMLIRNIDRVQPNKWTLGECPETESRNMSFSDDNCLSALQRICEEFKFEFQIELNTDGKNRIDVKTVGSDLDHKFAYGRGKGLYELTRQTVDSENIVTRLYAFGAEKNLKSAYRGYSRRLKPFGVEYLEDTEAQQLYGVIEAAKNWDDIFPHRKGTVTALGGNVTTFIDDTMNFDLNEMDGENTKWLIPNVAAKIAFTSGKKLRGYDFDIQSYNHATKTFVIKSFTDERGDKFPSETSTAFQFDVGDNYVIYDIVMPDQYVEDAEKELLKTAQEYLNENKHPRISYTCVLDERYLKRTAGAETISNVFSAGDYVTVVDESMNIDGTVRIQGFTRDVINPYKYTLTLSDFIQITRVERLIADTADIKRVIYVNKLDNPQRQRDNWRRMQEMLDMIFDEDGYFEEKLRPLIVETSMLAVGTQSGQFTTDIVIQPNYNGNQNLVYTSGGMLVHFAIEKNPRTWNIKSGQTVLQSAWTAYYIYLRCVRDVSNLSDNSAYISPDQIRVDEDPMYYHFLIGIIHSISDDGVRRITLTYGFTAINGRYISTGRIQSADGKTWFDLDSGEISGRIKFISNNDEYKDVKDVESQANDAKNTANFAQSMASTAQSAAQDAKTIASAADYLKLALKENTTVEGGLISTSLIKVGSTLSGSWTENAGINGVGFGTTTVRFYAGGTLDQAKQGVAKFIVLDDGSVFATKGKIGGWNIDADKLYASDGLSETIISPNKIEIKNQYVYDISPTSKGICQLRLFCDYNDPYTRPVINQLLIEGDYIGDSISASVKINLKGISHKALEINAKNAIEINLPYAGNGTGITINGGGGKAMFINSGELELLNVTINGDIIQTSGVSAINLKTRRITLSHSATNDDCYIVCNNLNSASIVYLPPSPPIGKLIIVKRLHGGGASDVTVSGNGKLIQQHSNSGVSTIGVPLGDAAFLVWDGTYWNYNRLLVN